EDPHAPTPNPVVGPGRRRRPRSSLGGAAPALADDSTGTISGTLTDGGTPVANTSVILLDSSGFFVSGGVTDSSGV
ncbi:MAG: hypothetical protein ACM3JP_01940, partial [Betaproteobacteria bacterium]